MWNIYKITNLINGKKYVGQTCRTIQERYKEHLRHAQSLNTPLANALCKYGSDKFELALIEQVNTKQEADEREKYWITYYKSNVKEYGDKYGYNLTPGGEGVIRIGESEYPLIYELWLNNKHLVEIAQITHHDRGHIARILKSYGITDEELQNRRTTVFRTILVYDIKGKQINKCNSVPEVVQTYNINKGLVLGVLNHHHFSTHKMIFLYEDEIDWLPIHLQKTTVKATNQIICINVKTNEQKSYNTLIEAAKDTNIDRHTIRKRIDEGIVKNGLLWKEI